VNADADDISGTDGLGGNLLKGFIDEDGVSDSLRCGGGEDEEPSGGDYGGAKSIVTGIDEMDSHGLQPFLVRVRWMRRLISTGSWTVEVRSGSPRGV
jgi:hypothetical protein